MSRRICPKSMHYSVMRATGKTKLSKADRKRCESKQKAAVKYLTWVRRSNQRLSSKP